LLYQLSYITIKAAKVGKKRVLQNIFLILWHVLSIRINCSQIYLMNLTIDIGNTATKVVVFDDTIPVYRNVSKQLTTVFVNRLRKNFPIENCMLSAVVVPPKSLVSNLKTFPNFQQFSSATSIPVKNLYQTPKTLGNDRLANAIAGSFLFPGKNVLIIDAGTCIKYDFVNSKKEYLGGSISPGMEMRFKALHHYTGKLPLVKPENVKEFTGRSTVTAIQTGVMIGIAEEIKGFIQLYRKKNKSFKIILTGGDASCFAGELNLSIFAAADLVNIGLNEIIRFNNNRKEK
jgi:type III pantothenate kinase